MAEFMDVIHTILRICKKNEGKCPVCILGEFACPNNARFDKTEEAAFRELEDAVVKWAEENPEPVYPTWREWLHDLGLIVQREGTFTEYGPNEMFSAIRKVDVLTIKGYQSIPADIAQKLGIEPKEGT